VEFNDYTAVIQLFYFEDISNRFYWNVTAYL